MYFNCSHIFQSRDRSVYQKYCYVKIITGVGVGRSNFTRSKLSFFTRSKFFQNQSQDGMSSVILILKVGGLDVETNRDRDRERPSCRD